MSNVTNHVIKCWSAGGPEVLHWAEHTMPVPAADEVLIRVAAVGVNRADILQRQGKYPPPFGASEILGLEVAGTIVALGTKVRRWKTGDRVCALLAGGGYAEYVAVPETHCLPVPPNLSLTEAAALPEAVVTVWANVFEMASLQPGETILVHGGSSGIGTMAIRLVKAHGARIFVTVGNDEKAAACRKLGADLAIDYKNEDFVEVIARTTAGQGVNVVLDMIGGEYLARNLAVLAPYGRHVSIATQKGRMATVDIAEIMQKRLIVTGSTLRPRPADEKGRLIREVEAKIWPKVLSGDINPLIYRVFQIKKVSEAHKMMESSAHIGKIVLEVAV
jgi:putative PIG3 family NAD(P)H quinone oxidoreductase